MTPREFRRRSLLRRRTWDSITGWLLGTVVVASVGLGAVFWSGLQWTARPVRADGARIMLPDDIERSVGDLVVPARILLLYPGGQGDIGLNDATGSDFLPVWFDIVQVLAHAPTTASKAGSVGLKTFLQAVATYTDAPTAGNGNSAAVEADFGPVVPWSQWLKAVGGAGPNPTGTDPEMERLVILPASAGPCGSSPAVIYLIAGVSVTQLGLSAGDYAPLCSKVAALRNQYETLSYSLVPLSTMKGGLNRTSRNAVADLGGLLVPEQAGLSWWQPGRFNFETPSEPQAYDLAGALFRGDVWPSPDHQDFQTTEGDVLHVDAATGATTAVFAGSASGAAPSWFLALNAAVAVVRTAGGWPPTAWLSQNTYSGTACTLASCTLQQLAFVFSVRYQGLPVLRMQNAPPPLEVVVSGTTARPVQYTRWVPEPTLAVTNAPPPQITAAQAVDQAIAHVPLEYAGAVGEALEVTNVMPTYLDQTYDKSFEPAWAVEIVPATGGNQVDVLVDAIDGHVLDYWQPD